MNKKPSLRKIRRIRKSFLSPRDKKIIDRFKEDPSIIAILDGKEIRTKEELTNFLCGVNNE